MLESELRVPLLEGPSASAPYCIPLGRREACLSALGAASPCYPLFLPSGAPSFGEAWAAELSRLLNRLRMVSGKSASQTASF